MPLARHSSLYLVYACHAIYCVLFWRYVPSTMYILNIPKNLHVSSGRTHVGTWLV